MATQVPYSGTLDVQPSLAPTPYREINPPIGAFGGGLAQATQHLGAVADQAGSEIYTRAAAMQEMKDNADAQAAISQYTQSVAEKQADFLTKQGKDAVDGLHPYLSDIETTRTQVGGSLTNPYSQQLYNEQTRFMSGRLSIGAADHAAQQNKAYANESRNASMESAANLAMADPKNYDQVFAGGDAIRQSASDAATAAGIDPSNPAYKLSVDKSVSAYYSKWLTSLAKDEPWNAQTQLDKVRQSGGIIGEDIGKVQDIITQNQHTVGARKTGELVMSGADLAPGRGVVDISRAQDAIGGYESQNNYSQLGPKITKADSQYFGQRALGRYQVMPGNLPEWLKAAGMPAMTADAFLASKDAQDQLFNSRFGQSMQQTGSFNAAADIWFTGSANPNPNVTDATATTKGHTPADYQTGTNARLAKSASLEDLQAHGQELASALAPGDSDQAHYTALQIEQQFNVQKATQRNTTFNAQQTIDGAMVDSYLSGKPLSPNDLQNDPKLSQAYAALPNSDRLKYLEKLAAMANAPKQITPEMKARYNELKGMSVQDPAKFLQQDPLSENFPWSIQKEFIDNKATVFKAAQVDPNIGTALRVLGPQLATAGLSKDKDVNGLNQFTGELMDVLKSETQNNARPLKQDEIRVIGARLLQDHAQANIFHGGSRIPFTEGFYSSSGGDKSRPLFKVDVPPGAASMIKADPKWAVQGITPTDADVQRIYVMTLYNQQFNSGPVRAGIDSK